VAVLTGLGLMTGAAALFWTFLPKDRHTHPMIKAQALSWIVPLVVMALFAIGLTLSLDAILRG
jgi:hypothetical protein